MNRLRHLIIVPIVALLCGGLTTTTNADTDSKSCQLPFAYDNNGHFGAGFISYPEGVFTSDPAAKEALSKKNGITYDPALGGWIPASPMAVTADGTMYVYTVFIKKGVHEVHLHTATSDSVVWTSTYLPLLDGYTSKGFVYETGAGEYWLLNPYDLHPHATRIDIPLPMGVYKVFKDSAWSVDLWKRLLQSYDLTTQKTSTWDFTKYLRNLGYTGSMSGRYINPVGFNSLGQPIVVVGNNEKKGSRYGVVVADTPSHYIVLHEGVVGDKGDLNPESAVMRGNTTGAWLFNRDKTRLWLLTSTDPVRFALPTIISGLPHLDDQPYLDIVGQCV